MESFAGFGLFRWRKFLFSGISILKVRARVKKWANWFDLIQGKARLSGMNGSICWEAKPVSFYHSYFLHADCCWIEWNHWCKCASKTNSEQQQVKHVTLVSPKALPINTLPNTFRCFCSPEMFVLNKSTRYACGYTQSGCFLGCWWRCTNVELISHPGICGVPMPLELEISIQSAFWNRLQYPATSYYLQTSLQYDFCGCFHIFAIYENTV